MVSFINGLFLPIAKFFFHVWVQKASNISLRQRFKPVYNAHPEYKKPIEERIKKEHLSIWSRLRGDINLDTLKICGHISGKYNPLMIPEEVFVSEIQPCLCRKQKKIQYLAVKSFYDRWFHDYTVFPKCYFHNIEGTLYDSKYSPIDKSEANEIIQKIEYPIVFKPNMDSLGGANVYFPKNPSELKNIIKNNNNFVVQEKIQQDKFFEKYHKPSLNTIRVDLYRSVSTNKIHFLHAAFRMGKDGGLDNETAGGIHCFINKDGSLNDYAVDKIGNKYSSHPNSKIKFSEEEKIPLYKDMIDLAKDIAGKLFLTRIVSLDMCLDNNQKWRVIEINLYDITIQFAQLGGKPFFGEYTNEVINYCKKNPWWQKLDLI